MLPKPMSYLRDWEKILPYYHSCPILSVEVNANTGSVCHVHAHTQLHTNTGYYMYQQITVCWKRRISIYTHKQRLRSLNVYRGVLLSIHMSIHLYGDRYTNIYWPFRVIPHERAPIVEGYWSLRVKIERTSVMPHEHAPIVLDLPMCAKVQSSNEAR